MLSRAVLPLTRPNVLTSTVRASTISVAHSRWYAKSTKPKTPYKLPQSVKSANSEQSPKAPSQNDYSAEQAEFDTKAAPATEAVSLMTTLIISTHLLTLFIFSLRPVLQLPKTMLLKNPCPISPRAFPPPLPQNWKPPRRTADQAS